MKRLSCHFALVFLLTACGTIGPLPQIGTTLPDNNPTPGLISPTPRLITPLSKTATPIITLTPTLPPTATFTVTPMLAVLNAEILGCNTSVDILHGMGEVTNAFVTIRNTGTADASNVCATLSATDEGRAHPDKTKCAGTLPAGYQVTFKLTIDSSYKQGTSIKVDVSANEGIAASTTKEACTELTAPDVGTPLDSVVPIP
jgi:hypothetical protein